MTEQLALKYRPASFDDLVGQRAVQVVLRAMVARDQVPAALLFKGSRGTGKTTTARILAAALNCDADAATARPCGGCVSCKAVSDGTSLDLVEVDAASNGLVDDIRALRQQVLYGVGGRWRVVVLDEAHSMSAAAGNALLKTLEEPPPGTVFILATTEPGRILDTVVSRCMPFHFTRIGVADIAGRLSAIAAAEAIDAEPVLLTRLAERADGSLRDAVMALDQLARVGIATLAGYTELMGEADHGPALLAPIVAGQPAHAYAALDAALTATGDPTALTAALTATLRDLLVLHAGGEIPAAGAAHTARTRLAAALDTPAVFAAIGVLWDLKTKIRVGDDPRAGLDLAVAMLLARFTPTAPVVPPAGTPAPARKLSLAEMAAIR